MDANDVRAKTNQLARRVNATEDGLELTQLASQLVPLLIAYWDVHPHSAMEMLESTTSGLPVSVAHDMVRSVVIEWKKKPSYDPTAGGSADHCYLSALILSDNFDLAERPWLESVLPQTVEKELNSPFRGMREPDKREALVRAIALAVRDRQA